MARRIENWQPTDHACRDCGGRVVRISPAGPTGGGNPVFRCADCGISSSAMGPECICWCGVSHKGQQGTSYLCVHVDRAKSDPAIEIALMRSGYGTERRRSGGVQEIAVITEEGLRWAAEKVAEKAKV